MVSMASLRTFPALALAVPLALAGCAQGEWRPPETSRVTHGTKIGRVPTADWPAPGASAAPEAPDASESVDLETIGRLREEGLEHSQVMDVLWHLTDLYGPRLTNSPQQRKAAEWASGQLAEWGLQKVAIEPWGEFGLGWSCERCVVEMTAPIYMSLIAVPKAWTSGLSAPVSGVPVLIEASSVEELEQYRGQLAGKIVLSGHVNEVEFPFDPLARRYDHEDLLALTIIETPSEGPGRPSSAERDRERDRRRAEFARARELRDKMNALFAEEGVAVVLEPESSRGHHYGVITLGSGGSRDPAEKRALPQVVVAAEQWNRIARLLQQKQPVQMSVDVQASFHDDDLQGCNVVGEIPGRDPALADQLVMLGAHFDSWHPATGTTDNAIGSAVVMEAARLLQSLPERPRRTIRVALWTGEEQGLLGSRGYAKAHFADPETMELKPEHARLSGYFNLDNGAGRIRGVYLQGNDACLPIFTAWLRPFHDLGAETLTLRDTGGTDHLAFDAVGLPGFQFIQDPLDYDTRTHHTSMDLYERADPEDARQAAVIMAAFAWQAAMRDEMLPRKPLPEPRNSAPRG